MTRHLESIAVALALGATACSFDVSIPPPPAPPGPGTLYGRVVFALPGNPTPVPAAGAIVSLVGGGLTTTAGAEGNFLLDGITTGGGKVLVRYSADGSGQATHQLLIDMATVGAGPGHQIGLGDVLVSRNATLHGRVQRGDLSGPSGHGGTIVYVPQGPFTTYTGDDGSYQLRDLPSGTLSIAFFRVGYQTITMDGVTLRPGQDTALPDQTLQPSPTADSTAAGVIGGSVSFSPTLASATGTTVVAVDGLGNTYTGSIDASGTFSVKPLPTGLYQLTVSHPGYSPAIASNLALGAGETLVLPGLTLSTLPGAGGGGAACVGGSACQLASNACHVGSVTCAPGGATCTDTGKAVVDGTACGGGATCQGGSCVVYCAGGGACVPTAEACHVGVVTCSSAGPTCSDTLASLPNGTACGGANLFCNAGTCTACTLGNCPCSVDCVPANPCRRGSRDCSQAGTCQELATPAQDGTACGSGQVCLNGACVACLAGQACQPANPCKTGSTSCSAGVSVCLETGDVPDFSACGAPKLCRAGVCALPLATVSTLARSPAPQTTPIQAPRGVAVAASGDVYFSDGNHHQVKRIDPSGALSVLAGAGTVSGGYASGYSGDGGPATAAKLSFPMGLTLDEANGVLYVADSNNGVVRQIQLGSGQLISTFAGGGAAVAPGYGDGGPATGAAFSNPTRVRLGRDAGGKQYLYVADNGHSRIRRVDMATSVISTWLAQNTSCTAPTTFYACGTEAGCDLAFDADGGAFVSGQFCGSDYGSTVFGIARVSPTGALSPVAGLYLGSTADGINARRATFAWPPGLALDAAGNLFAADASANLVRRIDGASGRIDTVVGTGAASSTGDGGAATLATVWGPWDLAFDPARKLDLTLSELNGNAIRQVLNGGSAAPPGASLTAVSGNGQAVPLGRSAAAPLAVKLVDGGGAPLSGYAVQFASQTPGGSVAVTPATTDSGGVATSGAAVGLAAGSYHFQASFADIHGNPVAGSPVDFGLTATPPAAGSVLTLVGASLQQGNAGVGGPAAQAVIRLPSGLALASDGTLYFADEYNHQIKAVSPAGLLTLVAGTGACSATGDGGAATAATLCFPRGLALDEAAGVLYVADGNNGRVRAIDLASGLITTLAGGGAAPAPGYGDGGPATSAVLATPTNLALSTDQTVVPAVHWLYLADTGHGRIRRIDLGTKVIASWLASDTSCSQPSTFYGCGLEPGCAMAFDKAGSVFVSGQFCGSDFNGNVYGIARVSPAGVVQAQVAGWSGGLSADGVAAHLATFTYPPSLAFDRGDNLFASEYGANRVRRIDGASGRITTVVGTGAASSTGDGSPAAAATIDGPWTLIVDPVQGTDFVFSENAGNTIRAVRGLGSALASTASLTVVSGNGQAPPIEQQATQPLVVRLADGAGAPLAGFPVQFTAMTTGGSLTSSAVATDGAGLASDGARVGRAATTYTFQASYRDIHGKDVTGSPAAYDLPAAAPSGGTIYSVVDATQVYSNTGTGGPAILATINRATGLQVASDGTIYFSDHFNHQVKSISPSGILSLVAGTGACAATGDGGAATLAAICFPRGLALDEPGHRLYVADGNNNKVRLVDLVTGIITTVAGGGTAGAPGFGDGGPATSASLSGAFQLALSTDTTVTPSVPYLYVSDTAHNRIRRVNLGTQVITTWLTNDTSCSQPSTFYACGPEPGCSLVFDAAGSAFLSGQFCGSDFNANVYGIARLSPSGTVVAQVAGQGSGLSADGISAHFAAYTTPPTLALDAGGNLYTSDYNANRIRRIDGASGKITTVVGTGVAATSGDGGPAAAASVNGPWAIAFDASGLDLVVTEYTGTTIRVAPGLGSAGASSATLSLASGNGQAPLVDQQAPLPLVARLVDGAGAPLLGWVLPFTAVTPGGSLSAASGATDASGQAGVGARVGRAVQPYLFRTDVLDLHGNPVTGSPVTWSLPASAPAAGTIFTAVDVDRVAANTGVGGPATLAHVNGPTGVQVAADGTIYFSQFFNHQVMAVSPAGVLSLVAGNGGCSSGGDGGPAVSASLCFPKGLALDDVKHRLYIADSNFARVRAVDLTTGLISLVAGSGSATLAPWGDGGLATSATLNNPCHLRLHAGVLYVADVGHGSVRAVDLTLASPTISTWLAPATPVDCGQPYSFVNCGQESGCDVAWDAAGTAYVSGQFCGQPTGGAGVFGVATWNGSSLVRVAGRTSSGALAGTPLSATGGVLVDSVWLPGVPGLVFDPLGRLVLTMTSASLLATLDGPPLGAGKDFLAGQASVMGGVLNAGTGVAGYAGDYVSVGAAQFNVPWDLAFGGGHAAITDFTNDALRIVW